MASIHEHSSEFFEVPRPLCRGGVCLFFLSPKFYIKERAHNFQSLMASPIWQESTTFFQVPRPHYRGESSEFSKVPKPLYRGRAQNFSKSLGHSPECDVSVIWWGLGNFRIRGGVQGSQKTWRTSINKEEPIRSTLGNSGDKASKVGM